ncbi:hypothetical protein B0H14DRAFT_2586989 [Mycena olivaceomarginata]|nr:hypothetical protein B0H14DRAFT_2586989 [Mycena olivaceomarginata]
MDSFTATTKKIEDVVLPPVNEDDGTGSSGSCVVCKEDTSLPTVNEDSGTGSSAFLGQHTSAYIITTGINIIRLQDHGWRESWRPTTFYTCYDSRAYFINFEFYPIRALAIHVYNPNKFKSAA